MRGLRSVDRSKFHLGDNASVAKIAVERASFGQAFSHFGATWEGGREESKEEGRVLLDILNWSHLQPSGVRHSSTSVDAAPPSPQEVQVEWGRNLLGRERRESFQVVSRSFFDYSILYTLCHDRRGKGGREGGRGDIKGFRNPKKAFKVLLYKADTKLKAAGDALRSTASASASTSASSTQSVSQSPFFFRIACGKLFQIFMKNNQPPPSLPPLHSTPQPATTSFY